MRPRCAEKNVVRTEMRRVVVTLASDPGAIDLLEKHMAHQKDEFDEWHLWVNSADASVFIKKHDWMHVINHPQSTPGPYNMYRFFSLRDPTPTCSSYGDAATVYAFVGERVAWLCPTFFKELFESRLADTSPFAVFANCVGNSFFGYIHHRMGAVRGSLKPGYGAHDDVASSDRFREECHRSFAEGLPRYEGWTFGQWVLWDHEAVALDAFAWLGSEWGQAGLPMELDSWLCTTYPFKIGKRNVVCGRAVCAVASPEARETFYAAHAPAARSQGVTEGGVTEGGVTEGGVTEGGVTEGGVTEGGVTEEVQDGAVSQIEPVTATPTEPVPEPIPEPNPEPVPEPPKRVTRRRKATGKSEVTV